MALPKKISVRMYPDRLLDQRFLALYEDLRMEKSNNAAGDFLRQCLFTGFTFHQLGVAVEDLSQAISPSPDELCPDNEKENTLENNNEVGLTNESSKQPRLDQRQPAAGAADITYVGMSSDDVKGAPGSGLANMIKGFRLDKVQGGSR